MRAAVSNGDEAVLHGIDEDADLAAADGDDDAPLPLELAERADVVVTMGCGDACPYIPGSRSASASVETVRGVGYRPREAGGVSRRPIRR